MDPIARLRRSWRGTWARMSRPGSTCRRDRRQWLMLIGLGILAVGCHQDMYDQAKIEPLEASAFFDDGMGARPPVPGTVFRGQNIGKSALTTGRENGKFVDGLPVELNRPLLERGRERFDIFCANCHSRTGDGDGMIVRRGFPQPPSLHIDRLRGAPLGYIFGVITNGHGPMPSYAHLIKASDRWAVVGYVRALQLSRNSRVDSLSPEERGLEFEGGPDG